MHNFTKQILGGAMTLMALSATAQAKVVFSTPTGVQGSNQMSTWLILSALVLITVFQARHKKVLVVAHCT